ncbi:hypothetical protein ACWC2K_10815 [Streptomyces chattanoogensis]|uniref:hypothetical protein n=1 Tax=Streptomyces chattanoogensis TaxID=66876 RepID=UPI00369CEE8B
MGSSSRAQDAREQAEAKLREEREKAARRSGRVAAADQEFKEKLRRQQEEQDRRDTFDANYDV